MARDNRKKIFVFSSFSVLFLIFSFVFLSASSLTDEKEIISFTRETDLKALAHSFPVDPLMTDGKKIYLLVDRKYLDSIRQAGYAFTLETDRFNFDITRKAKSGLSLQSGLNGAYHSYTELSSALKSLAASYPTISRLYILGKSLENRNIYALKISDNVSIRENEPKIALVGCHHAREWISVEVPLLIADYLLKNYSQDIRIKNIVDSAEIWVVPLVNPDGLDYSIFNYRLWRKNRRLNDDGSYGVDLNRNYSYQWGYDNSGSSPEPSSEVFRGTEPFSEPETIAIKNLFINHRFSAVISYHSYSQSILYPWGYVDLPTEKEELFKQLATAMADLIYQVNGRRYEVGRASASLYLTNGDFTDWVYGFFQCPAFTIELPPVDRLHGGFVNSEEDIQNIFRENLPAALHLMEWAVSTFEGVRKDVKLEPKIWLEKRTENVVKDKSTVFKGKESR